MKNEKQLNALFYLLAVVLSDKGPVDEESLVTGPEAASERASSLLQSFNS
jgi:hypothetical protein